MNFPESNCMVPMFYGGACRIDQLPAWGLMWTLAAAMFIGCKWVTWRQSRGHGVATARSLAYLFAWPGLDAKAFLQEAQRIPLPSKRDWTFALVNTLFGATLLWGLAPILIDAPLLLKGWIGMVGLIFLLHFGFFQLLSLFWQCQRIEARPLMNAPIRATSLSDFWGRRWNSAFNDFVHDRIFRRSRRLLGVAGATMLVFLVSGLIHDLVISVPAGAGFGLPTLYFLLQGAGLLFERSKIGGRLGLRHGIRGWTFVLLVAGAPAFWLFHPAFVMRVIIPFMQVLHAA